MVDGDKKPTPEEQRAIDQERREKKRETAFHAELRKGGQRRHFQSGTVLYERKGTPSGRNRSERVTYLDRASDARQLMSHRLVINDGLRSVGNLYGGSVQMASLGVGTSFASESVDGGRHATGGVTLHMIEAQEIARIAQTRLATLPMIRHAQRSREEAGPHKIITPRELVDAVCVEGMDIKELAFRSGWWVNRNNKTILPKQQSQKLKAALISALEEIDDALAEKGIDARRILGVVEVR